MIFDKIYKRGDKYFYMKYGSFLEIESGTVYNLERDDVEKYVLSGYKECEICEENKILVKEVCE